MGAKPPMSTVTKRIAAAIEMARADRHVTAERIASTIGVNVRSGYRYRNALVEAGFADPIAKQATGEHSLDARTLARHMCRFAGVQPKPRTPKQRSHHEPQSVPIPRRALQSLGLCVCGLAKQAHPTKTCRSYYERGL